MSALLESLLTREQRAECVETEESPAYMVADEDAIIERAKTILAARLRQTIVTVTSPAVVRDLLQLRLGGERVEKFGVMFLNAQNGVVEVRDMFTGTLTQTSVYPREVVRAALELDAAAVVLYHNHPSGTVQPSRADEALTQTLKAALALVDVRVLDHIIVSATNSLSMAEKGLL